MTKMRRILIPLLRPGSVSDLLPPATMEISSFVSAPETTPPLLASATIEDANPNNVILVFDEAVTGTNLGFTLAGTTSTTFASISGSGTTWTGVLASPAIDGEVITLSYNSAVGDFADLLSNVLASITNDPVTNNVIQDDLTAPVLSSATIEDAAPTNVVMVFSEAVTMTNLVSNGFSIGGTTSASFSSISGSGTTWTGVLAVAASNGETITISYNSATGDVADTAVPVANDLATFTGTSITNNVAAASSAYLFDGGATSYFVVDQNTLLDDIISQTWIIRAKVTGDNINAKGFIGDTSGGRLQFEVETDNLLDVRINDVAVSSIANVTWSQDQLYHQFALVYDSASGIIVYEDAVSKGSNADVDFQSRVAGRVAALGIANGFTLIGEITDIQFYNRNLTPTEVSNLNTDLTDLPTDHATSLVANFAGNKTGTTWTSEVGGFTATNQGGVTL